MRCRVLVLAALVSWYSTESCRFNSDPKCPTASGRSLYELEREGTRFAASWDYPFGTKLEVCNPRNGKCTIVTVLDRGPARRLGRSLDLGRDAFKDIAGLEKGVIHANIKEIKDGT